MKRRDFLVTASAASALTLAPSLASAFVGQDYKPGLVTKELEAGKTVFLDFYTSWCTTCAAQGRTIQALVGDNPAYEENISFIKVDWDVHRGSTLSKALKIPRRSTLVVLKQGPNGGIQELGRIVAGTSTNEIKALLDTALEAAVA